MLRAGQGAVEIGAELAEETRTALPRLRGVLCKP